MHTRSLLAALAAFALTGCGPLFFLEAETEQICKTFPEYEVAGIPAAAAGTRLAVEETVEFDLAGELPAQLQGDSVDGEIGLLSLSFTATRGISNFAFVEEANIQAMNGEVAEDVLAYTRPTPAPTDATLAFANDTPPDLFKYLAQGVVKLKLRLAGELPTEDWAMDAKACFHVRTRLNYTQLTQ